MCRSIKVLRSPTGVFADSDARAAALQYVRKVSGYRQPSRQNAPAFDRAVEEVAAATERLLEALGSNPRAAVPTP